MCSKYVIIVGLIIILQISSYFAKENHTITSDTTTIETATTFQKIAKNHTKHCKDKLGFYYNENSLFFICAYEHAVPVQFCQKCVDHYSLQLLAYDDFINSSDVIHNVSCKSLYIDVDRLNLIQKMHEDTISIWESGFCSNCFDWKDEEKDQHLSNDTIEFFDVLNQTLECINASIQDDVCLKCAGKYQQLNSFFEYLKNKKDDKICFDIQDVMNRTRSHWSGDLKCCKSKNSPQIIFYVLSSFVTVLPVIFYITFFIHTKHMENQNEFMTASDQSSDDQITNDHESIESNQNDISEPGPSGIGNSYQNSNQTNDLKKPYIDMIKENDDELILSVPTTIIEDEPLIQIE